MHAAGRSEVLRISFPLSTVPRLLLEGKSYSKASPQIFDTDEPPFFIFRCILFLYHALDSQDGADEPLSLAFRPGKAAKGLGGRYKLIIASNRDEFMDRRTEGMHFWSDKGSNVLAGDMLAVDIQRISA